MTKLMQKKRERFHAEEAARLLRKVWKLSADRERPDFVVTEESEQFGLEITQIFVGPQGGGGSSLKAGETKTQRIVNELQRQYEAKENVPHIVKFVGNMEADNMDTVIPWLLALDLPSKDVCDQFKHDTTIAHPTRARLHVYVTKGLRADWYSVNDRVGFVDCNPHAIIAARIAEKAANLLEYKKASGCADIRLLLVADRITNSGKLMLDEKAQFDLHGFGDVYLFP